MTFVSIASYHFLQFLIIFDIMKGISTGVNHYI